MTDNFRFSELPYTRPDFDALRQGLIARTEAVKNAESYEALREVFLEFDRTWQEVSVDFNLAFIRNTLDTTDPFYEQEIAIRRTMLYPPFCDICVVGISSVTEREAATAANIFEALLREAHSGAEKIPLVIYRATKCDMERVCGQYRYKIMLKCKNDRRFREFISNVRRDALKMKEFSDVNMYVDINGDIP